MNNFDLTLRIVRVWVTTLHRIDILEARDKLVIDFRI